MVDQSKSGRDSLEESVWGHLTDGLDEFVMTVFFLVVFLAVSGCTRKDKTDKRTPLEASGSWYYLNYEKGEPVGPFSDGLTCELVRKTKKSELQLECYCVRRFREDCGSNNG